MSYAVIMAYVDLDDQPEARVRLAADLSRRFDARLVGMSAQALRPPFVAGGVVIDAPVGADEIVLMKTRLADKGDWFRTVVAPQPHEVEWRAAIEMPTLAIAEEARAADLVVIGNTRRSGDMFSVLDPGSAILKLGCPTLVVPDGVGRLRCEHVVVGWKDVREARRAIKDALPFLHEAARVLVAEVCDADDRSAAQEHVDDVVRYLARHRVKASGSVSASREGSAAATLMQLAHTEGADLLVAGAYGHSRLGEWIFGGVTGDLLASCPFPCLMTH